jgi:hypothetical protein
LAAIEGLKLRSRIAGSGGFSQVGEIRMVFTVRAAVRSLAAVAERRKIARIAGRPAAGASREVDNGYASVDRLLIDKIFSKRYLALDRFGGGNVSINRRHCSLAPEFVESTRRHKWPQHANFVWDAEGRVLAPRANPLLFQAMRREE